MAASLDAFSKKMRSVPTCRSFLSVFENRKKGLKEQEEEDQARRQGHTPKATRQTSQPAVSRPPQASRPPYARTYTPRPTARLRPTSLNPTFAVLCCSRRKGEKRRRSNRRERKRRCGRGISCGVSRARSRLGQRCGRGSRGLCSSLRLHVRGC